MSDIVIDRPPVAISPKTDAQAPPTDTKQHPQDRPGGLGAAIAVGVVGAAVVEGIKIRNKTEQLNHPSDWRIKVEGGMHPLRADEYARIHERFEAGDFSYNSWSFNGRVEPLQQRLLDYRPAVLTIDGMSVPRHWGNYDKEEGWLSLPVRPRELQPDTQKVFAIATDNDYLDFTQDNELEKKLKKVYKEYDDAMRNKGVQEVAVGAGALGFMMAAGMIELYRRGKERRSQRQREDKHVSRRMQEPRTNIAETKMSRRSLLQIGGLVAGAVATEKITRGLGFLHGLLSTDSPNVELSNTYKRIAALLDGTPDDIWLDGRTALLIAKHEDAMTFLRDKGEITDRDTGSVILGPAHLGKADLYLRNKEARDEAIRKYAELMRDVATEFAQGQFQFAPEERAVFQRELLETFSSFHVVEMTDPEENPTMPKWYLNDAVHVLYPNTPSPQVAAAIQPLRM